MTWCTQYQGGSSSKLEVILLLGSLTCYIESTARGPHALICEEGSYYHDLEEVHVRRLPNNCLSFVTSSNALLMVELLPEVVLLYGSRSWYSLFTLAKKTPYLLMPVKQSVTLMFCERWFLYFASRQILLDPFRLVAPFHPRDALPQGVPALGMFFLEILLIFLLSVHPSLWSVWPFL